MRVKEFMELYSDSNFHFMTSKGYLFLNSDQVKSILFEGQKEAAKKELGKGRKKQPRRSWERESELMNFWQARSSA